MQPNMMFHDNPHRRQLLFTCLQAYSSGRLLGGLTLSLGPMHMAWGSKLLAVRVWPAKEYTRVTLESDTELVAKHFGIGAPHRFVVDIESLELTSQLQDLSRKIKADDPFISRVRVGQYDTKVVRLVFDLKQAAKPEVFVLQPVAAYKHRLVFDLYPDQYADDLSRLVAAPNGASSAPNDLITKPPSTPALPESAASVSDALDDFVTALNQPKAKEQVHEPKVNTPVVTAKNEKSTPPKNLGKHDSTKRLMIVAIDPGHGGEDPGAIGPSGLYEKDVVLAIALKLRDRINATSGMRAMLTRDGDFFVPLGERVRKARSVEADLFISIHADAFLNPQAKGASVFVLSERGASSTTARWMAQRENASDLVGGVNVKNKDSHVMKAMLDMSTTAQIKDSMKLGGAVLGHLGKVGKLHKPKVEQASFAVLKAPDVPSILVETGFISNPYEESQLASKAYQHQLADALMLGIKRYFAKNPPIARSKAL